MEKLVQKINKYKQKYINLKNKLNQVGDYDDNKVGGSNKKRGNKKIGVIKKIGGGREWTANVSNPWFNKIRDGVKTVEGRLKKGNFAEMAVGDIIIFSLSGESSDSSELIPIKTIITNITNHKSFEDMISQNGLLNVLPGIETIQKGVDIYRQFYSQEKEREFGVVGIHINLI